MGKLAEKLEKVGVLKKGEDELVLWRLCREGEVLGYFVLDGGYLWFYSFPSLLEEWVEGKLREGYKLELEIEKFHYRAVSEKFAGKELGQWYEKFLSYYDPEEGLNIPRVGWEEYWQLLKWERDVLQRFFSEVLMEIRRYSIEVSRKVAEEFEKYDEEEREGVVIFTGIEEVEEMLADKLDGESELWKKWISEKVFLNLMGVL
jgi:hypothetical protein